MKKISISKFKHDFATATVFKPQGSDNGNQYLFVVQTEQKVVPVSDLCGVFAGGNQFAFIVSGDWEAGAIGKAISAAMAATEDETAIVSAERDWLVSDEEFYSENGSFRLKVLPEDLQTMVNATISDAETFVDGNQFSIEPNFDEEDSLNLIISFENTEINANVTPQKLLDDIAEVMFLSMPDAGKYLEQKIKEVSETVRADEARIFRKFDA